MPYAYSIIWLFYKLEHSGDINDSLLGLVSLWVTPKSVTVSYLKITVPSNFVLFWFPVVEMNASVSENRTLNRGIITQPLLWHAAIYKAL